MTIFAIIFFFQDVQWNDLDYMLNANDFTYDKTKYDGLPQFVDKLHEQGMHYIILIGMNFL